MVNEVKERIDDTEEQILLIGDNTLTSVIILLISEQISPSTNTIRSNIGF